MIKRLICAALAAALFLIPLAACAEGTTPPEVTETAPASVVTAEPSTESSPAPSAEPLPTPTPISEPVPEPTPEPVDDGIFTLSFAGDCTLGTEYATYGSAGSFVATVKDDYAYPFSGALQYFEDDDFTMVNLECALTNATSPAEKTYRFRGPPEYAKILTAGSVECVSLANNHSADYGAAGLADTRAALEAEGVLYAPDGGTCLFETERGVTIGVCGSFSERDSFEKNIRAVREAGADIVIMSFHFGNEGSYEITASQSSRARAAIDAGADIVFGQHPHVLQKIEEYGGGVIFYSLGNFSFGGNRNPADRDTAVIRQSFVKNDDGSFTLSETEIVPFSLSGTPGTNDYRPVPYEADDAGYERVLKKLAGDWHVASPKPPATTATPTETLPESEQEPSPVPEPETTPVTETETPADISPEPLPEEMPEAIPEAETEQA